MTHDPLSSHYTLPENFSTTSFSPYRSLQNKQLQPLKYKESMGGGKENTLCNCYMIITYTIIYGLDYLNVDKHSMVRLIQWLASLWFQWNLKRQFSLAIRCKHYSHLNLHQIALQKLINKMYGFPRGYRTHMFYNNTIQHNTAQPKHCEIYETIQLFLKREMS